jgi:hypothetical protein
MGFDEIYVRVPAEQVEWLKEFRFTHKRTHLLVDGAEWEYISCGQRSYRSRAMNVALKGQQNDRASNQRRQR